MELSKNRIAPTHPQCIVQTAWAKQSLKLSYLMIYDILNDQFPPLELHYSKELPNPNLYQGLGWVGHNGSNDYV